MYRTIVLFLVCSIAISLPAFGGTNESAAPEPALVKAAVLPFGLTTLPQLDQKSWQEEYDAAASKRSRGRMLMWIGAGVTGLGVMMVTKVSGDCARFGGVSVCEYDYRVPGLVTSSGAGLLTWGIMQQRDASRTIRDLDGRRPAKSSAESTIILARGTSVAVGAGSVAVRHDVSW